MADAAQQEAYMQKLRGELQNQLVQDLMNKITDNCFKVPHYASFSIIFFNDV